MVLKHKGQKGRGLGELKKIKEMAEDAACKSGLDFFPVIFEKLTYEEMSAFAAKGGFPKRYRHWRFGMEFERLRKSYRYGLHKIYEMVINNDPCYAYLLEDNHIVDQKLVIPHVYAHCDFFKNNNSFSKTNRKMMDTMANHSLRVEKLIDKYGFEAVENFIDICLTIEDLIDPHSVFIKRQEKSDVAFMKTKEDERPIAKKISAAEYMDDFINPRDAMQKEQEKLDAEHERRKRIDQKQEFPENPEKDILMFLIEYAPIEEWQREILSMIREEAYYFAPQAETKIMNEGWATYWHEKLMIEFLLTDAEVIDFADHHSGTIAARPGQINPYRLGWQLWKDIEDRWNKGKFGRDYDDCDDYATRKNWDKQLGLGRKKIFEIRKVYNDITFIDEFFTEEFCREHRYLTYSFNKDSGMYEVVSREWERIKEKLLSSLANSGKPFIYIFDGNYKNRGELLLYHRHEGRDLQITKAKETLQSLFSIWKRPVHIQTVVDGKKKRFVCNSNKNDITEFETEEEGRKKYFGL